MILSKVSRKDLQLVLDIITRDLPISDIIDNNDEEPANHDTLYAEVDHVEILEKEKYAAKLALENALMLGINKQEAIEHILQSEPFSRHRKELLNFLKNV